MRRRVDFDVTAAIDELHLAAIYLRCQEMALIALGSGDDVDALAQLNADCAERLKNLRRILDDVNDQFKLRGAA